MCDTLVTLSPDGVLFAKNSDRDPNEAQVVEYHPAGPGHHAVLISRPWWLWGAEMGANDHGVVIGNEAVFTKATRAEGILTGMDLLRMGLEGATDRHGAVELIVSLLQSHGQGGSCSYEHPGFRYDNSFLIADPDGAVVVETAGRDWATEEVRGSRSISNGLTIPGFAEKYADPVRSRVAAGAARRIRTEAAASRARAPLDLMAALRDHGRSSWPTYSVVNGALQAPCAHGGGLVTSTQTTASWVAEVSARRHYVTATSAPCTSVFKPVHLRPLPTTEPGSPRNRYHPDYLWWRHERMHRDWVRDPDRYRTAQSARDELERRFVAENTDPADAWAAAEAWEQSPRQPTADGRPAWVRSLWRRWDRQAEVWT